MSGLWMSFALNAIVAIVFLCAAVLMTIGMLVMH
jgi:hypothetical protein